jgi:hypothetical protein
MTRRVILDWANYQGVPDASAIKMAHPEVAAGVVKACEGMWKWTNPDLDPQVASLRKAGLPVAFYNFVHPGFAGTADAQTFLDRIEGYNPWMAWQDCEVSDGVSPQQMLGSLLEDARYISHRYPMRTGFYSAKWWWDPNTIGSVAAHMENWPFWVAGYTSALPPLPVPWTHPLMWQFTDNYFGMKMDASLFLGTDEQWNWLMGSHVPSPVPPVPPRPTKVIAFQNAVHASPDGIFGPDTDRRAMGIRALTYGGARFSHDLVHYAQLVMAFGPADADGIWGPKTTEAWLLTVRRIQSALGVAVDGDWGKLTEAAFLAMDPLR